MHWSQLYPGVASHPGKRRSVSVDELSRRGWFDSVVNTFKRAASAVVDPTTEKAARTVAQTSPEARDRIVGTAVEAFDKRISGSLDKDIAFATPQGSVSTPWGAGYKVFSKTQGGGAISIYCVKCGAQGKLHVKGTVTFNVFKFSATGTLSVSGALQAALELGLVATYTNTWSYEQQVYNQALSPLTIPGIVVIGPMVTLSAGGSLNVAANGQLLAGVTLDWPAIQANIDIFNPSSATASGFKPTVSPVFQVSGAVSAKADAYLKVSIGFGINILSGKITKQIALVEKPDLSITATASGSKTLSSSKLNNTIGATTRAVGCAGVSLDVAFNNYVYADLAVTAKPINTVTLPILSGKCIALRKRRSLDAAVGARTIDPAVNYTELNAVGGGLKVHWADDGNLYALNTDSVADSGADDTILFSESVSGNVLGDHEGRLLHGYVDTLASLGVSRLRLADGDSIPQTSVMLTLAAVDPDGSGPSVFLAFDTAGNSYYPLLCVYEDLDPKIFIAKDAAAGAAVLEDAANAETLTGGSVKECGVFSIT